jgi:hypothetical protein
LFHSTISLDGGYLFGFTSYSSLHCAFTAKMMKAQYQLRALVAEDLRHVIAVWSSLESQSSDVLEGIHILKTLLQGRGRQSAGQKGRKRAAKGKANAR